MTDNKKTNIPELLAPAGSPLAFEAAIEGGADAIYVGGLAFNARINAKNFSPDELKSAISKAHAYGVRVYVAANTLIYDRELEDYLRAAEEAYLFGADAMIVADVGAAREIKKRIPIELHASTQVSGHNLDAARLLADAGFSRMVCAREMSREDLASFCKDSPIESEVFVHGALCVCHSGQCLFSSMVGKRSGNRGECAQPCRLPYKTGRKGESYPLSLRDLSLAKHVRELCDMGVSSFKIEGRMKSPEYVRDATRIWRGLLDERRDANADEMAELAKIFSRGGFTDGYYTGRIDRSMLGVRSESDKKDSTALKPFTKLERRVPIRLYAEIRKGQPMKLRAACRGREAYAEGEIPQEAINAPLSRETVERNLSKLGSTAYSLEAIEIELDEGLMTPISALNALRRAAIEKLTDEIDRTAEDITRVPLDRPQNTRDKQISRTALFFDPEAIPPSAKSFFERIYVPLESYEAFGKEGYGVMLPEIIYDSERERVARQLAAAREAGATHALIENIGQIELARSFGFEICADIRLNAANNSSVCELEALGVDEIILSPELSLAQQRDIAGRCRVAVFGRLPLMITEKCVGKELGGCEVCKSNATVLCDRRGVEFPVRQRPLHRSVIFNSVPIYMGDRADVLGSYGVTMQHFLFTTESREEVADIIERYSHGREYFGDRIKRLK